MAFRDLDEFLVVEPIVLPIRGKAYAFPGSVSARTWLRLQRINEKMTAVRAGQDVDPDDEVASDVDEQDMMAEMMGDVQDEMIDDGLTSAHIKAVFYTLIAFHLSGQAAAEAVWEAQGAGELEGKASPNRAERRHPAPPVGTRPTKGLSPASSSGVKKTKATSSVGDASSNTGD